MILLEQLGQQMEITRSSPHGGVLSGSVESRGGGRGGGEVQPCGPRRELSTGRDGGGERGSNGCLHGEHSALDSGELFT